MAVFSQRLCLYGVRADFVVLLGLHSSSFHVLKIAGARLCRWCVGFGVRPAERLDRGI